MMQSDFKNKELNSFCCCTTVCAKFDCCLFLHQNNHLFQPIKYSFLNATFFAIILNQTLQAEPLQQYKH
jgi:hypothetical protein